MISFSSFFRLPSVAIIALFSIAPGLSLASDVKPSVLNPLLVSTGLKNLGNTCYMNAQLECAFHIPAVRRIILATEELALNEDESDRELSEDESEISPEMSEALNAMQQLIAEMTDAADKKLAPVVPRAFCLRLGIPVMVQQDSQEFWKLLLPALNKESLSDLYKGSFEDYITALDGSGREKRREELFLDLSLDITSRTLTDSIKKSFGEPEILSVAEGNGWRPEKGAEKVDAHKGSSLISKGLPSILQCHLKRFNYDWQTDTMTKLNNRFDFPDVLKLSELCESTEDDNSTTFDLQSIVIHVGEYGIGHYYAYVRPDIQRNNWYRFNDDIVEEVTFQEVIEDSFGGKSNGIESEKKNGPFRFLRRLLGGGGGNYGWGGETSNAYVVQYVRRSDITLLYNEQ